MITLERDRRSIRARIKALSVSSNLITFLSLFFSSIALADMTVAKCHVVDRNGVEVLAMHSLYPLRESSLFKVNGNFMIDVRYHYFTSTVSVTMLEMPNYPFTFGEQILGQTDLRMTGEIQKVGKVSLNALQSGARFICKEQSED